MHKHCITVAVLLLAVFLSSLSQERKIVITPYFSNRNDTTINSIHFREIKRPKVALVLSGGGARGMAHLGVLQVLEKNNIPIDLIVGTSIGGIIGGLYASGYSTSELLQLIDTTDWNYVLSFTEDTERKTLYLSQKQTADKKQLTVRFDGLTPIIPSAISSGQRLTSFINQLTLQAIYHPVKNFNDLKVPFRSVATDLISGEKIVFDSGNLSEALRASISVPLLFSPLKKDTLELTDGGLVSNIPVEVAQELGADIIIVVNTVSPLRTSAKMKNPWEVADQIINIMAQKKNKEALESATVVITPELGDYSASDFNHLDFVVTQGYFAARNKIIAIQDSIMSKTQQMLYDSSPLSNFTFNIASSKFNLGNINTADFDIYTSSLKSGNISTGQLREVVSKIYSSGWFSDVYADIIFHDTLADIAVNAVPNPTLNYISVKGNSFVAARNIDSIFNPLLGKPVNEPLTRLAIEQTLSLYREEGYSLARVEETHFDTLSGTLSLIINEGIIYKIYLKGKEVSRDWVVWRELGFRDGNVFTVNKAKQALVNLYGTNLFEQVLMDVAYENNLPTIIIQMEERATDVSRLGFRADNERSLQATLEFRNENLLGTATEIGINFAGGLRNRKYVFDFQANRIFNSYFTFNLDAYYDLRNIYTYIDDPTLIGQKRFARIRRGEYKQEQYGTSIQLGRQVEKLGIVNAEYRVESDRIKSISGSGYSLEQFTLQALRLSSTIDSRDRYPFSRSGSLTNFFWETAISTFKNVVGDIGYSKIYFAYETNISYGRFTLTPKVTVGFGDQTVPLSQQFALGGEDSFFGLREYNSRGRQIFLINLEARAPFPFKVIWDTYFRLRYDLGNIWPQREDIRLRDFRHSIGATLSLDTPIGLANLSIGRSFYIRKDLFEQPLIPGPVLGYFSFGYPIL